MVTRAVHDEGSAPSDGSTSACVDVVVVAWNGERWLPSCLDSLFAQTHPPRRVIVVDNASSDGTREVARRYHPRVELLENSRNLGFAEGANLGIRDALARGAEFVAVLNQDTEPDARWLEMLLDRARSDATVAAVGSRLLLATHRTLLNGTGIEMNLVGRVCDRGFARVDAERWREPCEVLGVSGGAMLLRSRALGDVGLFDPSYFAYYEDADLSVRLWEAGHRLVYEPRAIVHHGYSASFGLESPLKVRLLEGNRLRFLLRHYPLGRLARQLPVFLSEEIRYAAYLTRRDGGRGAALCLGIYARALAGVPGALRHRLRRRRRSRDRSRWWRFVTPHPGYFDIGVPRVDFALAATRDAAETDRVIMGVNDRVLGDGWYPLENPSASSRRADAGPSFRAFGAAATCFLRVASPGSYVLQLHFRSPARHAQELSIERDGEAIERIAVRPGEWQTRHVALAVDAETVGLRLTVDAPLSREESGEKWDVGLHVNEISLLGPGSPFLRPSRA